MATPAFWQQAWDAAVPSLTTIRTTLDGVRGPQARSPRVGQLDSELLDQELLQLLREPINKSLDILDKRWRARTLVEPELTLLVQVILYKYSIWDSGASYGAKLQNLRYTSNHAHARSGPLASSGLPRDILLAHATLTVFLPYAHSRLRSHALSASWPDAPFFSLQRRVWELLLRVESVHGLCALVNFLAFLYNGRYRTVVDRLLGMRLVPVATIANRNVSYEFMNRQMVWHVFTEFLLFFLPFINTRKLKRSAQRAVSKLRELPILPGPLRLDPNEGADIGKGKYASLPEDQCAICAEDASTLLPTHMSTSSTNTHPLNTPYITSCGHTYCYTCVADRLLRAGDEGEEFWECLRCDGRVKYIDRVEERTEEGTGTSEYSGYDLDEMSLNSEDTLGTLSALSE